MHLDFINPGPSLVFSEIDKIYMIDKKMALFHKSKVSELSAGNR